MIFFSPIFIGEGTERFREGVKRDTICQLARSHICTLTATCDAINVRQAEGVRRRVAGGYMRASEEIVIPFRTALPFGGGNTWN